MIVDRAKIEREVARQARRFKRPENLKKEFLARANVYREHANTDHSYVRELYTTYAEFYEAYAYPPVIEEIVL